MLTQDQLRAHLLYDENSGLFTSRRTGKPLGWIDKSTGYRRLYFKGKCYHGHKLAWLYVYGVWAGWIDHRDRDGSNNRIDNLREATQSQNLANQKRSTKNTTGFKGVSYYRKRDKYRAFIRAQGRSLSLGSYLTAEAAHEAYLQAAKEHFGEFASGG